MSAVPWLSNVELTQAAAADPVLVLCGHYADLVRHGEMLLRRWSDREAWLGKHRDWFRLSDDEQKRLPEAQLLYAIDADYERCTRESVRVLRRLRSVPAVTIDGAIAQLVLNRPGKRNALDRAMWVAIPNLVAEVEHNPEVKVLVVRGATREAFSAGADIGEFKDAHASSETARAYHGVVHGAYHAIESLAKPTIAEAPMSSTATM